MYIYVPIDIDVLEESLAMQKIIHAYAGASKLRENDHCLHRDL